MRPAEPGAHRACALDDADPVLDEQALLSIYNRLQERRGHLLLTARTPVGAWTLRLPDLASRLRAAPAVAIGAPDDALLGAVLLKLFADRQLVVSEAVIEYLVRRMERSFDAAKTGGRGARCGIARASNVRSPWRSRGACWTQDATSDRS